MPLVRHLGRKWPPSFCSLNLAPSPLFPFPLLVLTTRQHSTQSVCILHLPAAFYEPRLYVCTVPAIIKFLPFSCGCRGGKLGNLIGFGFGLMAASRRWRFFTDFSQNSLQILHIFLFQILILICNLNWAWRNWLKLYLFLIKNHLRANYQLTKK